MTCRKKCEVCGLPMYRFVDGDMQLCLIHYLCTLRHITSLERERDAIAQRSGEMASGIRTTYARIISTWHMKPVRYLTSLLRYVRVKYSPAKNHITRRLPT